MFHNQAQKTLPILSTMAPTEALSDPSREKEEEEEEEEDVPISTNAFRNLRDSMWLGGNKSSNDKSKSNPPPKSQSTAHSSFSSNNEDSTTKQKKDTSEEALMNADGSSVRFDKVRQREFRMTLGKHPDAHFVPVECSWDFDSCVEIDVDEHDHQKAVMAEKQINTSGSRVPRISKNKQMRIAMANHTRASIVNVQAEMKEIRQGRNESKQEKIWKAELQEERRKKQQEQQQQEQESQPQEVETGAKKGDKSGSGRRQGHLTHRQLQNKKQQEQQQQQQSSKKSSASESKKTGLFGRLLGRSKRSSSSQ